MKTVTELTARLQELHLQTRETPLFNPVFQLSLDLSRNLESGALSLGAVESMIGQLECQSLDMRSRQLRDRIGPVDAAANLQSIRDICQTGDFTAFRAQWENPALHAVFTAHPTFLMTPDQREAVADAAGGRAPISASICTDPSARAQITLVYEHGCAMAAIANAQGARDRIVREILAHAAEKWPENSPDDWQGFAPMPFRFASWVGYDMDGRTDIKWFDSIGFRLSEKAQRLDRYADALSAIDAAHMAVQTLRDAAAYTQDRVADFQQDLSQPAALSQAANRLTADHPHKLLSLAPIIAQLETEAQQRTDHDAENPGQQRAIAFKTLAAAMRADGLGMGQVHFRVNTSQLHNAIRRRIDPDNTLDLGSQSAMATLRDLLGNVQPLRSNFAALAIESSTAIRQFLVMTQFLHHIDGDAPIRMLIAECEQPSTVLAALYFAKLFGIADKVDVSPLFETESALEHGGRFLDALIAEPAYQDYARQRGRVAIQTGFSDAGRFVGQIPASLAIERLQGRMADAMRTNGLTDVAALIFNTHGESMGRGAHPGGMDDRLAWPLSAWTRRRFARAAIRLEPEVSFQGGDGYLHFASPDLALATLTRIAVQSPAIGNPDAPTDPFYRRTDLSLDFYRAVRSHQRDHLESQTYSRALTAFGLGLIDNTGSRVSRRQSDLNADRDMNLRQIRAIPHNAVLQQLGYPVNVIAGIGSAADGRYEELAQLLHDSERGRQIVRLVRSSNALASIKTVAAFGELFNSAFWASRPYRGTESHLSDACRTLAEYLTKDDRTGVFRRLASRLRVDALKLHRLLDLIPDETPSANSETPSVSSKTRSANRENTRRSIGALQALRLTLLQHMFLKAVSIPAFSRANDISRDDVLEMVFTLRVDEALAQMRRAYPVSFPQLDDFDVDEPSDYPDGAGEGYTGIHRDYIDPIDQAYRLILRIGGAIAHEFGAHG